ncbi:MAG: polymer-forming cytoskeletal protein [Anaerolineae bacterium]|nr:polymer-forming cytoskeletal protein [Anaerolineae bacterium]
MFKKRNQGPTTTNTPSPTARVTSVLGDGIAWKGAITGHGGVRIEGAFDGDISLRGMLVIGQTGRITCDHVQADIVIVAGALRGNITAEKIEIRSTGRVWGDVITTAFATEEGAFLRGQIQMEDSVALDDSSDNQDIPEESSEINP